MTVNPLREAISKVVTLCEPGDSSYAVADIILADPTVAALVRFAADAATLDNDYPWAAYDALPDDLRDWLRSLA